MALDQTRLVKPVKKLRKLLSTLDSDCPPEQIHDQSGLQIAECWVRMVRAIRNLGRAGICSMAVAVVDNALWDLKARLLGLCAGDRIGRAYVSIPAYGSGGFASYTEDELKRQLSDWGCTRPVHRQDENRQRVCRGRGESS